MLRDRLALLLACLLLCGCSTFGGLARGLTDAEYADVREAVAAAFSSSGEAASVLRAEVERAKASGDPWPLIGAILGGLGLGGVGLGVGMTRRRSPS